VGETKSEPVVRELSETQYAALPKVPKTILLDVRDRASFQQDHRTGAVNIPLGEILQRGPVELSPANRVVIDCLQQQSRNGTCSVVAHQVESSGVIDIVILRRP